jgi:hypothetical protein
MAYGVKYRLDFEDHEGNGKRLDILKNNYTGSILPLVGGAEPVKIKWDGDDDFYSPIIGSTCNISLYQTDETNYDDFFNEPEREYKVEVYTAQAIRDEFKNNVQDDGGIVEAADCLNGSYYDTGTLLQRRVVNDGGNIEAVDCVSAVLTETQDNYTLFWTGWLLSDQFAEVLAPNPQPINLTAIDGLGELDNYNVDNSYYSISFSDLNFTLASIICKALDNVGLDIDVLLNNDIEVINFFGDNYNLYTEAFTGNEQIFLSDDYEFFNVKEFLENILKNINARIFQANGKWVILNNSTYSEEAIIDYVKQYKKENDALPAGIGTMRQEYLKGDIERLYFKRFNSSGTLQGDYNHQGLRTVRTDLQPLDQNLTREAERGYKAVRFKVPPVKGILDYNDDVGFEYQNTTHWTISNGSFTTNQIALSGSRSFKTTATNFGSTPSTLAVTGQYLGNRDVAMKLKLNYYYDTNNATQTTTLYNRFWCQIYFVAGSTFYYDVANNNWTTTVKYFFFENDKDVADQWVSQSLDIAKLPASAGQSENVYLRIYGPRNYLTNYQGVYIDNTVVFKDEQRTAINERLLTQDSSTNTIINETEIDRELFNFTLGYTDIYDSSDLFSYKRPYQATAKQQLNDFRNTVLRYEGTLYNNQAAPLTPMDKIRINFTNFSEGDSLLIDGLTYSLKTNKYDVIAHKPNQDGDTAATETTKTEVYNYS